MSPHIVFVHIGPSLPAWLVTAAVQARRFNDGEIWLVASARALAGAVLDPGARLRVVSCEALGRSPLHRHFDAVATLDRRFRDGFWFHATERFFYLETLMDRFALIQVVHLENDVMLYAGLDRLMPAFDACYPAMAATFDAPGRCIPGLVYARDRQALGRLNRFIVAVFEKAAAAASDMALLAGFRSTFGAAALDTLPIVPAGWTHFAAARLGPVPGRAADFWNHFDRFGAIFDAAAIGQYLGGVDPRNSGGADTTGFINETSVLDPSRFHYRWQADDRGRRVPVAIDDAGRPIRIVNLHIHAKCLNRFVS